MALKTYNLVVDTSGEIVATLVGDTALDPTLLTDNAVVGYTFYEGLDGDDPNTLYYPLGIRTTRPSLTSVSSWNKTSILANGSDTATFGSALPNPTIVSVEYTAAVETSQSLGQTVTVTDGSLSINTTIAGTFEVTIEVFPYQRYTQTITAS